MSLTVLVEACAHSLQRRKKNAENSKLCGEAAIEAAWLLSAATAVMNVFLTRGSSFKMTGKIFRGHINWVPNIIQTQPDFDSNSKYLFSLKETAKNYNNTRSYIGKTIYLFTRERERVTQTRS